MSNLGNAVLEAEVKDALDFLEDRIAPMQRGDQSRKVDQLTEKLVRILHYIQVGEWVNS